jgi:hypothetical protein
MPINLTITADTHEELARLIAPFAGLAPTTHASQVDPHASQEAEDASDKPIRGSAAEAETFRIIADLDAAETLGALADVKADNLSVIDRLPKYRQEEVQAAHDARHAALTDDLPRHVPEAEVPIPAQSAPETPAQAPSAPAAATPADLFNSPTSAPAPAASPAPAPAPAPANENNSEISDDQVRTALEACMKETSFVDAQARMQALGYSRLSDVPKDRAAREAFIAKMNARNAAA